MTMPEERRPGQGNMIDEEADESFPASDPPSFTPVTGTQDRPTGGETTPKLGFGLFGEEHPPDRLVKLAQMAEEADFDFLMATDHFHPWISQQGEGVFVWSLLGGVASVTRDIKVGTGVTCPSGRIHPAIIAHAAATTAAMMPGRFTLGLGSGEALNEHVTGDHWYTPGIRLAKLREAIKIIRRLWSGEEYTYHGDHFTVEAARLYTLPDDPPEIVVAAAGPRSAELAAENDGLVVTGPDTELIERVREGGGEKSVYGQITLCWDEDEERARQIAHEHWPISALSWLLRADLRTPAQLEDAVKHVPQGAVTNKIICTSSTGPIVDAIQEYAAAGIDHIYIHQVGPRPEAFVDFFSRSLKPALAGTLRAA